MRAGKIPSARSTHTGKDPFLNSYLYTLAQINTLVIMGLADQKDRQTLTSSAKQDLSHMDTEIQVLGRGDAIISSIGIPLPVSTKIHLFEDYIRT